MNIRCRSLRRLSCRLYFKSRWTSRLFEVEPQELAIPADFCASGGGLFDQDQQQKRFDLIRSCVDIVSRAPNEDHLSRELLQYQEKGTVVDDRTGELYSMETPCSAKSAKNNEKGNIFCTCGVVLQGYSIKTAQIVIRLFGLQCQIRTRGLTWHFRQEGRIPRRVASFLPNSEEYFSKVRIHWKKTQTIVSSCKKTTARTKS